MRYCSLEEIYYAGGCLWGVQEYMKHLPGVVVTEAGRANGSSDNTQGDYDGYAECVRVWFDPAKTDVAQLTAQFFEIIDPFSENKQGPDVGPKYRTGIYSLSSAHLAQANAFISAQPQAARIAVEVLPLANYVRSDELHQDRLSRCPNDYCHIPKMQLHKYKNQNN